MQLLRKTTSDDSAKTDRTLCPLIPAGMRPWQVAAIVVALFLLALMFPYTGDDWAWGCEIGLQRLSSWFADYNGRYVGNLLVLALTRNVVLRSIVVAMVMYAIALCVDRIVGARGPIVFWSSLLLLLCMPVSVRAQGVVWTSGFTNYAVPALFVLVYFAIFRNAFFNGYEPSLARALPCLLLGFANALIIENVTLFNVGISVVLLVYTRVRHGKWDVAQIAFLVGSIAGCVLMFTNGAYRNVATGTDSYRKVTDHSVRGMAKRALVNFVPVGWVNNSAVNAAIALLAILEAKRQSRVRGLRIGVATVLVANACVSARAFVLPYSFSWNTTPKAFIVLCGLLTLLSFVALCLLTYWLTGMLGLAAILSVAALTAPLLVVSPVGPRNFLPTYCLLVLVACLVLDALLAELQPRALSCALPLATLLVYAMWVAIFGEVCLADMQRRATVDSAIHSEAKSLTVKQLPHSDLLHVANPSEDPWNTRFKLFYGLGEDVELVCV